MWFVFATPGFAPPAAATPQGVDDKAISDAAGPSILLVLAPVIQLLLSAHVVLLLLPVLLVLALQPGCSLAGCWIASMTYTVSTPK